jgi:hypothetical protein
MDATISKLRIVLGLSPLYILFFFKFKKFSVFLGLFFSYFIFVHPATGARGGWNVYVKITTPYVVIINYLFFLLFFL